MTAIEYLHLENFFSLIIAGEDVKRAKPNPEIYNTILYKLNLLPENAIVFEDSNIGIEAAKAAGISYIKVTKTYFHED